MRNTRPYTYLGTIQGMCGQCKALVPSRIIGENGSVFQERLCPSCGKAKTLIAESSEWYNEIMKTTVLCKDTLVPGNPVQNGCPKDCGPCQFHANACLFPVFPITNAGDLDCPICLAGNKHEKPYFMSGKEIKNLLDKVISRSGQVDLINITGGEPTMHPDLLSLLDECNRSKIGKIAISTSGVRLSEDEQLCRELAKRNVSVILPFNTFKSEIAVKIHGSDVVAKKLQALENFNRFGVAVNLLYEMVESLTDLEIGNIINLAKEFPVIHGITVNTMSPTNTSSGNFRPRRSIPLDRAARIIAEAMNGKMKREHFFPHPNAHPLCRSMALFLKTKDSFHSLTNLFPTKRLREILFGGYILTADEKIKSELEEAANRIGAEGGNENLFQGVKNLITDLYPPDKALSRFEKQNFWGKNILTIFLHAYMNEDTFDLARIVACPEQVLEPGGRMIPACLYNLSRA